MLDQLFILTKLGGSRRPLFFSKGWGDIAELLKVVQRVEKSAIDGIPLVDAATTMTWGTAAADEFTRDGIISCPGSFESPIAADLPPEAQRCHFRFCAPAQSGICVWEQKPDRDQPRPTAVLLLLPATGEQGSSGRFKLATPLAKEYGWCTIIVTAPFYGSRKPKSQRLHHVDRVDSFCYQSLAIMTEAAALLSWCDARWPGVPLCVSGFSWGAAMSSCSGIIASQWMRESARVAVVPYVGSATPAVIADGLLASDIDWTALQRAWQDEKAIEKSKADSSVPKCVQAETRAEPIDATRQRLITLLADSLHLRSWQQPIVALGTYNKLAAVQAVSMRHDAILLPRYADELSQILRALCVTDRHEHRTYCGGHVSAFLRRGTLQRDAIVRAMAAVC